MESADKDGLVPSEIKTPSLPTYVSLMDALFGAEVDGFADGFTWAHTEFVITRKAKKRIEASLILLIRTIRGIV
ncbi:MAG: hypothetical protein ABL959_09695 [Pyrinomonadaceae bacterium]